MKPRILLTGASGYVGGRLLERLQADSVIVRCMSRKPATLQAAATPDDTELVQADVLEPESLHDALRDVDTAYYLIHSMKSDDFQEKDRRAAENFARAAHEQGVRHIVYLGGLGREEDDLSAHLRSRQEVGRILRQGNVPCTEFRAAVVLGGGSISFRMIQALSHRLPIMLCPSWTKTATQPIASRDIVEYLYQAKENVPDRGVVYEVGGADVVDYLSMIREYCDQAGLIRVLITVPVLSPQLSSWWLALVTPATADVGRELITGLKNTTIVRDQTARGIFPEIVPRGLKQAMQEAIAEHEATENRTAKDGDDGNDKQT